MHRAPFPRSSAVDLPPFALQWVLPIPDYYDGSVSVGLAPFRPSHVPVVLHVQRDVGAPFIPFNVLAAHRPSCEEYAPRNLDGPLMMAPQPGVVAASVKCHRWRLGFGQSSSHLIARVSQDDTVHAFP